MSRARRKRHARMKRRAIAVALERKRNTADLFNWLAAKTRGIECQVAPYGILPYVDKDGRTVHATSIGGKVYLSREAFDAMSAEALVYGRSTAVRVI